MGTEKETLKRTRKKRELKLHKTKAKRNRLVIISAVILAIMGISIYFAVTGRAEQIRATWIEPQIVGDAVSIPVSAVENKRNVHFKVETEAGDMHFMAYIMDGKIFVRANVCPPCRSIGFSLKDAVLICDMCLTTFNAETGEGIGGPCVGFPRASIPYGINGGNIIIESIDLVTAYQNTFEPGWP
jgi:nitrite reductase/ring-hydroxylating ferredoxin subunit